MEVSKKTKQIIFLLIIIFIGSCICLTCFSSTMEPMSNLDNAASLNYSMGAGMGGTSWSNEARQYAKAMGNMNLSSDISSKNRGTPVPLPEGQMFFFQDNEFRPDCCPSVYSSSLGCSCITPDQALYLQSRAGNSTLTSEY